MDDVNDVNDVNDETPRVVLVLSFGGAFGSSDAKRKRYRGKTRLYFVAGVVVLRHRISRTVQFRSEKKHFMYYLPLLRVSLSLSARERERGDALSARREVQKVLFSEDDRQTDRQHFTRRVH